MKRMYKSSNENPWLKNFLTKWFYSTNAKDIGVSYLIFSLFGGLLGTAFSILIRIELSGPGVQYINDNQLYNSIITAHAILMIFFMVKKQNTYIYNQINNLPFLYNIYYIKNKIIIENFSNNNNYTKIKL